MVDASAETEVFSKDSEGKAIVFFTAKRVSGSQGIRSQIAADIVKAFNHWHTDGWITSVGSMFGDHSEPMIYETGFAHDVDIAGVFEAPSLTSAYQGISHLKGLGWDVLFETEWSVGVREFQPVVSRIGRKSGNEWAFFALWEWNDAWQKATPAERVAYDLECDEAFTADVDSGVSIAGRHRLDAQSPWHHLGIWDPPSFEHIEEGMQVHEKVADFKFTTSRHYVGRRRGLTDYLGAIS